MKSRATLAAPFLVAFGALALAGCWTEAPDNVSPPSAGPQKPDPGPKLAPSDNPRTVKLLTGEEMTVSPGEGVGVYVERLADGRWLVSTSCDTKRSGYACGYRFRLKVEDGFLQTISGSENPKASGLLSRGETSATLAFVTGTEIDTIELTTSGEGAKLSVEAQLEKSADPRLFYWIGPEVLHRGGPTNPLVFEPVQKSSDDSTNL